MNQGDYLLAINGRERRAPETLDQLLSGLFALVTLAIASTGIRREIKVRVLDVDTAARCHD